MPKVSNWMHVEVFTVNQAAALWCGLDPSVMDMYDVCSPSEAVAVKQMITGAIVMKQLAANSDGNTYALIGNYSESLVSREELKAYAEQKRLYPAFLFDTLAPFNEKKPFSHTSSETKQASITPNAPPIGRNVGGRPVEYDWDSFIMEIIHRANCPDGLPETQADLIRDLLQWFSNTYGNEPAESAVKQRISKIYKYLKEAKNQAD